MAWGCRRYKSFSKIHFIEVDGYKKTKHNLERVAFYYT